MTESSRGSNLNQAWNMSHKTVTTWRCLFLKYAIIKADLREVFLSWNEVEVRSTCSIVSDTRLSRYLSAIKDLVSIPRYIIMTAKPPTAARFSDQRLLLSLYVFARLKNVFLIMALRAPF